MDKGQFVLVAVALAAAGVSLSGCGAQDKIAEKLSGPAIEGFLTIAGDTKKEMAKGCESYLDMANITSNMWWPGCGQMSAMKDFADKCPKDGCVDTKVVEEMDAFNKKYGGKLVSYKSRAGKTKDGTDIDVVDLKGWWLPAPNANKDTPRIVVQHGFRGNSNKVRQMFAAYLLRKLGFSVLMNNLRDHCYSGKTGKGLVSWGHAYPLDELGAWDFAKDYADVPIDAKKVGLLGFSMGAFTTANAFGLDGNVPAAWIDGPPFSPKDALRPGLEQEISNKAGGNAIGDAVAMVVSSSLYDHVWEDVEEHAKKKGIDLSSNLPEKMLPTGPDTKRPVFVTANRKDQTVPYSNGEKLTKLLKKFPKKYDLKEFWLLDGGCIENADGSFQAHCLDHLTHTEEYTKKLCSFWSGVFGTDPKCGAAEADAAEKSKPAEPADAATPKPADADQSKPAEKYEDRSLIGQDVSGKASNFIVGAIAAVAAAGLVALARRGGMRLANDQRRVLIGTDAEMSEIE